MSAEMFDNLKEIVVETPVDAIVAQINKFISSEKLMEGDKIPSERILSDKFNVGRMFVRDALVKMEFYGILKKDSQGARIVQGNIDSAFTALGTNALSLIKPDYKSLIEARIVLEIESAGLAAERSEQKNIEDLEEALALLGKKVSEGKAGLEEDLLFHISIAEASQNDVLKYLISQLASHMMNFSKEYDICRNSRNLKAYKEHVVILEHIKNGDIKRARQAMRDHLTSLFDFIR